jgi:hypothetical protein
LGGVHSVPYILAGWLITSSPIAAGLAPVDSLSGVPIFSDALAKVIVNPQYPDMHLYAGIVGLTTTQ